LGQAQLEEDPHHLKMAKIL